MFLIPAIVLAVIVKMVFNTGMILYAHEGLSLHAGMNFFMAFAMFTPLLHFVISILVSLFRRFHFSFPADYYISRSDYLQKPGKSKMICIKCGGSDFYELPGGGACESYCCENPDCNEHYNMAFNGRIIDSYNPRLQD